MSVPNTFIAGTAIVAADVNENFTDLDTRLSALGDLFTQNDDTTAGLTWGYRAGRVRTSTVVTAVAAGTVTLTASATNYVEVTPAGSVSVNQTAFTAGRIPLRKLSTDTGSITTNTDCRTYALQNSDAETLNGHADTYFAQSARTISTTAPLTGGGNLTADRTLAISAATSGAAGSMSATDKAKLDASTSAATASALVQRDASSRAQFADPSAAQDAATKAYVDAVAQGFAPKAPTRVATTANITLSGAQTIDGVSVIAGDRVLVKNQSTGSQNGIYLCASGAWSRATDFDLTAEALPNSYVFVSEGTANADTFWLLTTNAPITLGSTSLVFTQFNSLGDLVAGNGLTKTGNQVDVNVDDSTIEINSDTLRLKDGGTTDTKLGNRTADDTDSSASNTGTLTALLGRLAYRVKHLFAATTLGDLVYGAAGGVATRLAGNTTTTRKFLRQTGDGTNSAAPDWDTLQAGDIPNIAESQVTNLTTDLAAKQPLDAELTAIAGLTSAADKGIQFTGSGAAGTFDLTAAGRALLDDVDATAQRATLGLGTAAVKTAGSSSGNVPLNGATLSATQVVETDGSGNLISAAKGTAYNKAFGTASTDVATGDAPSPAFVTLTDGATVTWAVAGRVSNAVVTLGGNRTLAITGAATGYSGVLIVKQDATGSRTLALPAGSKVVGGGAGVITLSTAPNAVDILSFIYDGTNYWWSYGSNFS